jgi:hypothetical protein
VLLQLLGPFIDTTERAPEQAMVNRLKEAVWDELVAELRDEDEEQEEEQEGSEGEGSSNLQNRVIRRVWGMAGTYEQVGKQWMG